MIIKGKSRSGPASLAAHLGNAEKNEKITLLETRGTAASDLKGALIEMNAYADGTRCQKPLYHAAISPEPPHRLTPEQRMQAIDALEQRMGLTSHARVVVIHEKLGREHLHVVWSRIDLDTGKAVSDGHNYRKHEEVARELERRFGHDRVQGAHHEREGVARPDRTPTRSELRQEERTGIKGHQVKKEVTALFQACDNAEAFHAALKDAGYILAQGDSRDFVIIDHAGGIHSLARRIDGINAAALREYMAPIDRTSLPTALEAKKIAEQRAQLIDDAKATREMGRREAAYTGGQDYVRQSTAALREHQKRQSKIEKDFAQASKAQTNPPNEGEASRLDAIKRRMPPPPPPPEDKVDPDRRPETPGGGRTRGR